MEKLSIKIMIGNRAYSMKVPMEEEQKVRGINMIFSNKEKPKLDLDNKSLRLQTLEEATKRILDSESRQGNVGGKEIEELRAAYLLKPSVDEKILNKSENMNNG